MGVTLLLVVSPRAIIGLLIACKQLLAALRLRIGVCSQASLLINNVSLSVNLFPQGNNKLVHYVVAWEIQYMYF